MQGNWANASGLTEDKIYNKKKNIFFPSHSTAYTPSAYYYDHILILCFL